MKKDRRKFFKSISLATAGIIGSGFIPKKAHAEKKVKWKMVTSWPKNFPGLGAGAETLANYINQLSGGTLKIKVYGANELVPPLVFLILFHLGSRNGSLGSLLLER